MVSVPINSVATYGSFSTLGQVPVMTVDQPLYALAKEIQCSKPDVLGEDKFLVMMVDLHIDMTFMKYLGISWFFLCWVNYLPILKKVLYLAVKNDDSHFYVFMVRTHTYARARTHACTRTQTHNIKVLLLFCFVAKYMSSSTINPHSKLIFWNTVFNLERVFCTLHSGLRLSSKLRIIFI